MEIVELAEDFAVVEFILDSEVVASLDRMREAELELTQPHVAKNTADLFHESDEREVGILV
ncbi:MAG: hypothetical protein WB778_00280 [Thermoplasmata archaeon]